MSKRMLDSFGKTIHFMQNCTCGNSKSIRQRGKDLGNTFRPHFSDEFYFITAKLIITETDWYGEDFQIIEIDLTNRNYQLIFELTLEED